jgi:hypothetical protein
MHREDNLILLITSQANEASYVQRGSTAYSDSEGDISRDCPQSLKTELFLLRLQLRGMFSSIAALHFQFTVISPLHLYIDIVGVHQVILIERTNF